MKLNINSQEVSNIVGYANVNLTDKVSLSSINDIMDFSCEEIIIDKSINVIKHSEAIDLLLSVLPKLSIGAKIHITQVDVEMLFLTWNLEQINDVLPVLNSYIKLSTIDQIMEQNSIEIISKEMSQGLINIIGKKIDNETN